MDHASPSGKMLYLILWGGTIIITVTMMMIGFKQKGEDKTLLKNQTYKTQTSSGEMINDLLLSGDELSIEEKKSFINLYFKADNESGVIAYEKKKENREVVYKLILQRKLNRLNRYNAAEDFSVRPVPK